MKSSVPAVCKCCGKLMRPVLQFPEIMLDNVGNWPKTIQKPERPSVDWFVETYGFSSDSLLCLDCFCSVVPTQRMTDTCRVAMSVMSKLMGELQVFSESLRGAEEMEDSATAYAIRTTKFISDLNMVIANLVMAMEYSIGGKLPE